MEDRKRKTGVKKTDRAVRTVPAMVWAVTGALFLAIILFAHALPDTKTAEAVEFYNLKRLERFRGQPHPRSLRIIEVGSSLSMCGLFFDEDMERFARENGLPGVEFVRFIMLDGALEDFTPLLERILEAEPDVVLFESRLFVMTKKPYEREPKNMRFFAGEDGNDDRNKLKFFFEERFKNMRAQQKKDNPNVPLSEKRVLQKLRQRLGGADWQRFRNAMEARLAVRPFSVPDGYGIFFETLRQKKIIGVLLDTPVTEQESSLFTREMQEEMTSLVKRYQEVYGLHYLAHPGQFGREYFNDLHHLNDRGREIFSRWLLAEIPALVEKRKTP